MTYVTKADRSKQSFDKEKVVRTCLRMRASEEIARKVANKVESKIYDGISTKKILQMIFSYLKDYKPDVRYRIDLRTAISLLRGKPDFEQFVAIILRELGYKVITNQMIRGKCVEHEIDAVATKTDEIVYVEAKHHFQPHTYTGLDTVLETNSVFEDLLDGFKLKKHTTNFNTAMIVCNTKYSDHAKDYANCRGIVHLGWKSPEKNSLEDIVEKNKLYPITFLKTLDVSEHEKLCDNGIILLHQLIDSDVNKLWKKTKISKERLQRLIANAREIVEKS